MKRELEESTAQDFLIVESMRRALHRAFKRGNMDRRTMRMLSRVATPEAKQLWLELQEWQGMAVRERLLYLGLTANPQEQPKLMDVALKAAESAQDRVRGKPTEHQQTSGRLTVFFGGLDPDRLPDAGMVPPRRVALESRTPRQAKVISNADVTAGVVTTGVETARHGEANGDQDGVVTGDAGREGDDPEPEE